MKRFYYISLAVISVLAVGVVGAVSASANEWLKNGVAITAAEAAEITGEFTLGSENGLGLKIKAAVLCSGIFVGTVGPGAADTITEVLNLAKEEVTLARPMTSCVEVALCTSSSIAPVDLPWKTELTSTTNDLLSSSGAVGNPGWEIACKTTLGTVEETCTTADQNYSVENDATESDVLSGFIKTVTGTCSTGGANTGWISSEDDGFGLISLISGGALTVS